MSFLESLERDILRGVYESRGGCFFFRGGRYFSERDPLS